MDSQVGGRWEVDHKTDLTEVHTPDTPSKVFNSLKPRHASEIFHWCWCYIFLKKHNYSKATGFFPVLLSYNCFTYLDYFAYKTSSCLA